MANEYLANKGGLDGFTADPHRFSRQAVGLHLGALAVKTTGAQVRGGVLGNGLRYVATTGLNATLLAGTYLLPTTADIGPVEVVVDANTTFTHDTAHASQPRTDLIIVEVKDNGDDTSTKKVRILKGTAGSGAPDPTLPSSLGNGAVVAIHRVLIPAAATSLSTITDLRSFTGGINTVTLTDMAQVDDLPEGTIFYITTTDRIGVKKAASYEMYARDVYMQRVWARGTALTVPTGVAYGFGTTPALSTFADAGLSVGPAYAIASPDSAERIRIVEGGAYNVRLSAFMSNSNATARMTLTVPAEEATVGFDSQGRASIVFPDTYISAGVDIHGAFFHESGSNRDFVHKIMVTRTT